jgi:hypothetical protein
MGHNFFASSSRANDERVAKFEKRLQDNRMLVVRRFARGNVALQHGRVLTQDQLEKERESLRANLSSASC